MYDGGKGLRVWLPSDGNGGIDFATAGAFYKVLTELE
jgi:hypothetical protein